MSKAVPNAAFTILINNAVVVTWEALASPALPAGDNTKSLALLGGALEIQNAQITGTHTYNVGGIGAAVSLAFKNCQFNPSGTLTSTLLRATGSLSKLVVTNSIFTNVVSSGEIWLRLGRLWDAAESAAL